MHQHQGNFMEKVCTLAMTGSYGAVMTGMYLWSHLRSDVSLDRSLISLIAPWIQFMVFLGGVALLILFVIQLYGVMRARTAPLGGHVHGPECEQHHGDHGPDQHPEGDHQHAHADCGHDHEHEHGWVPMRYIPLIIPLLMWLLGLPNTSMIAAFEQDILRSAGGQDNRGDVSASPSEMVTALGVLQGSQEALAPASGLLLAISQGVEQLEESADVKPDVTTDLPQLALIAASPDYRERWRQYRCIEVEGMLAQGPRLEDGRQLFQVVRLRMACCLNDARPVTLSCMIRKPLDKIKETQWVSVMGKLDFMRMKDGTWKPALRAFRVTPKTPPANPYIR